MTPIQLDAYGRPFLTDEEIKRIRKTKNRARIKNAHEDAYTVSMKSECAKELFV